MLAVLRLRDFRLIWLAEVVTELGNWTLQIALPFYVYESTGSALATGTMFIVQVIPRVLLSPVAGVYVDRWDRRRTMIAADLVRAAILPGLLLVPATGNIWIVYVVGFAGSAIGQLFIPAAALVPRLVAEQNLMRANALSSAGVHVTVLVGPPLGAMLLLLIGLQGVVMIDAATFVGSAVLLSFIRSPATAELGTGKAAESAGYSAKPMERAKPVLEPTESAVWREMVAALAVLRSKPALVTLFVALMIVNLGEGIVAVLAVPWISEVLQGGPTEYGWIAIARGAGGWPAVCCWRESRVTGHRAGCSRWRRC